MGRFEKKRCQEEVLVLNEKLRALQLEHDMTAAQLEQLKETSLGQMQEVSNRLRNQITSLQAVLAIL